MFYAVGRKSEKPMDIFRTMKDSIIAAGFGNVQEQDYKIPIGPWAKHPIYEEAGRLALEQFMTGLEGYVFCSCVKPKWKLTVSCQIWSLPPYQVRRTRDLEC